MKTGNFTQKEEKRDKTSKFCYMLTLKSRNLPKYSTSEEFHGTSLNKSDKKPMI